MVRIEDGWATRVVREHVGAAKFDAVLEQTLRRDVGEEELLRMEKENRRKGLSAEGERILTEAALEYIETRKDDLGLGSYSKDLTEAEAQAVDALVADFAPRVADEDTESAEAKRKRLQAELRRVAREMEDVEEGSDEHRRLKKRYRELQKRLRELPGGDADREKSYPLEDFSEQEDRGGGFFGMEEMLQAASEDTDDLPQQVREDLELQEELRRQSQAEHFGPPDPRSDEELWAEYQRTLGEDA